MMFIVTSLDRNGCPGEFAFQLATFEEGLDFLSRQAARGKLLLGIAIIDTHSQLQLPVVAFDGANFSRPMRQLQAEWQAILAKPMTTQRAPGEWVERWLARCEIRVLRQARQIAAVRYELAALDRVAVSGVIKRSALHQYHIILPIYEAQLSRTCALRQRLQQRRDR